jgi:hypothetical protein
MKMQRRKGEMDYQEFREQYEQMHPASIPRLEVELSSYPNWTRYGVFAMFLSAALLSGVHTIPVAYYGIPGGDIIGETTRRLAAHSSFVAVELAILLSAFVLLVKSSMKLGYWVIGVCFFIAIVANVTSIAKIYNSGEAFDLGGTIVSVAFGVGMPAIALMAGKLFVHMHNSERSLEVRAKEKYKADCVKWDSEIEKEYKKWLKDPTKSSIVQPSNERPMDVSTGQQPVPAASRLGHDRVPDASERVRQFFTENERALWDDNLGVRKIADHLGVGRQTVANVRQELRAKTKASNGHSEPVGQ